MVIGLDDAAGGAALAGHVAVGGEILVFSIPIFKLSPSRPIGALGLVARGNKSHNSRWTAFSLIVINPGKSISLRIGNCPEIAGADSQAQDTG